MVVFFVVIVGGLSVLAVHPPGVDELADRFRPFLQHGGQGLVQAMGYTFIALQGFDLIAAVGGEVKRPERNIPRAMLLSLGAALLIYIPLLFLIVAVGSPDQPIAATAEANPEILVAVAARNFLGPSGYWLVVVAGVLSMLSALQANLLAASRFARTMASDRTMPHRFHRLAPGSGTPIPAIYLTAVTVAFVLIAVPDVAAAGAMSSLIFLTSFALTHGINYLVRTRIGGDSPFHTPLFPLVPAVGGACCVALALFQSVAVPSAGVLTALWLALGAVLFMTQLAPRARVVDASAEARDPGILRLRGRSPVVLVPVANPASAPILMTMADALAPHSVARVLLLSVVRPTEGWDGRGLEERIADAQSILGRALSTALEADLRPEALITVSEDPWTEIVRVARRYSCSSLVLGVGTLGDSTVTEPVEELMGLVSGDVLILRAPRDWSLGDVDKVLVPAGGRRDQSPIRARLIGSLCRARAREVTYLRVLPEASDPAAVRRATAELQRLASDEAPGVNSVVISQRDDMLDEVVRRAAESDLVIVGLQRLDRQHKVFGERVLEIARHTDCPLLMISSRR